MMSMHGFAWQLCFRLELKRIDGENSVKEIMCICDERGSLFRENLGTNTWF